MKEESIDIEAMEVKYHPEIDDTMESDWDWASEDSQEVIIIIVQ